MEQYLNDWCNSLSKLLGEEINFIPSHEYFPFKVFDIVRFTFDDTLAKVMGFYTCVTTGKLCAILGYDKQGNHISMCLTNLRLANNEEKRTFKVFSNINSSPVQARMIMILQ